jgi:ribosomal protein L11 methyltransferase
MPTTWKVSFATVETAAAEAALEAFGATIWATDVDNQATRFDVYFETEPDISGLVLPEDAQAEGSALPDKDWVSENQKDLPPVIVPPFHLHGSHDAPRGGGWLNIEMEAGNAFGSGHHGTTQGCLALLAIYMKAQRPRHIADIGCGSGVLAIAAAKAGCHDILAGDNDPLAVKASLANARRNGVQPNITTLIAEGLTHRLFYGRRFDLILANILAAPLCHLAQDFKRCLTPNGRVIVSGILNEQARQVIARYRAHDLTVERKIIIGAWTSLCFKR